MDTLPEPLRVLVSELASLPGIGPKSALRLALTMLKWPEARTRDLGQSIAGLRDKLHLCRRCNGLSATETCAICSNPERDEDLLCLVSEWDSLLVLEDGGFYKGLYMILGGLLAPLDGVDASGLEIGKLRARLAEGRVREVILALGTTLEAENTASYIKGMLEREFPGVRISRLAQGIPLGAEVKYMDRETLRQSLVHRQEV